MTVNAESFATAKRSWPPREGHELQFFLTPPSVLTGRLVDAGTRQGIEGRVTLLVRDTVHHVSSTVHIQGEFRFDDLPDGPGVIYARADGFAPTSGKVTIGAGKELEMQIGLLLEAVASGRVVLGDSDRPLVGATVRVGYDPSMHGADILAGLVRGDVASDSEGAFRIRGLIPDTPVALRAEFGGMLSDVTTIPTIGPGMERLGIVLRVPSPTIPPLPSPWPRR